MPVRIMIADDHGVLRAGLRAWLDTNPKYLVVGEAGDSQETLELAVEVKPDVLLLDISMPVINGIDITRKLHSLVPKTRILILTVHEDERLAREAIEAGASGYIIKRAVESELFSAINAVCQSGVYIDPSLMKALLSSITAPDLQRSSSNDLDYPESLTTRELDVLRLLVKGYTNRQIATRFYLSPRTVETHRANLLRKLNLRSRVDLVNYAEEHNLLEKDPSLHDPI